MAKKRVESQTTSLTPDHKKLGIDPICLVAKGMQHIIGKLLTRATILFRLHLNPRFVRKVMGFQSHGSPNWRNFGTPTRESRERKII